MPFIYRNLALAPHDREETLPALLAAKLSVPPDSLTEIRIIRKGIDARKKSHICSCISALPTRHLNGRMKK
jgi:hypothetical protein